MFIQCNNVNLRLRMNNKIYLKKPSILAIFAYVIYSYD